MKRVLLIAYMFPPIVDGGAFRPAAFARYLPEFGYEPIVLTRPDSGNLPSDASQLEKLPPSVRIERVGSGFVDGWNDHFRRRLAWLGPIESALGRPRGSIAEAIAWRVARRDDLRPWEVSWMGPATEVGLQLIDRFRPRAILATGPPFETLKAAWSLHRQTRLPLIADFRDPWTYGVQWNPGSARRARRERAWEVRVVRSAAKILVVTPSMERTMKETYPDLAGKIELVMNGYEDADGSSARVPEGHLLLSYVGSVMERRLPAVLFEGLRRFRTRHPEAAGQLRVRLVGPNLGATSPHDRIRSEDLSDVCEWLGPVSPDRSRELMRSSHVLLHIEATATYAVSGKLFEYLAAKRPIVGLTPPGSDDEIFLNQSGAGTNVGLDDADRIERTLYALWNDWRLGRLEVSVDDTWLRQFHRREQTRKVAKLLDEVAS